MSYWWGVTILQVSSDDHQMPVVEGGGISGIWRRGRSYVRHGGVGPNSSRVMVTWEPLPLPLPYLPVSLTLPLPLNRMTDRYLWKHYLPATPFADINTKLGYKYHPHYKRMISLFITVTTCLVNWGHLWNNNFMYHFQGPYEEYIWDITNMSIMQ